jgi:septum site-determining protein MinC
MNNNDAAHVTAQPAFEIRFGQVGLAQMRIRTTEPGILLDELTGRIASAPRFFERAALCLDLSALGHDPEVGETRAVLDAVRRTGMLPVGLANGTAAIEALAQSLSLPVLTQFRAAQSYGSLVKGVHAQPAAQPASQTPEPVQPAPTPEAQELSAPSLMHHRPVRSGQRLYARHRDLVVTATVGAGAEVMADGCVHVYGSLRGRAMAGARGDVSARVFCQEFHAELVSIAGVFRVFETIPPELAGQPVQAWLDGDDLRFARIGQ